MKNTYYSGFLSPLVRELDCSALIIMLIWKVNIYIPQSQEDWYEYELSSENYGHPGYSGRVFSLDFPHKKSDRIIFSINIFEVDYNTIFLNFIQ